MGLGRALTCLDHMGGARLTPGLEHINMINTRYCITPWDGYAIVGSPDPDIPRPDMGGAWLTPWSPFLLYCSIKRSGALTTRPDLLAVFWDTHAGELDTGLLGVATVDTSGVVAAVWAMTGARWLADADSLLGEACDGGASICSASLPFSSLKLTRLGRMRMRFLLRCRPESWQRMV